MNMISQLRQKVQENGTVTIDVDDFNQLQAEWIKRTEIEPKAEILVDIEEVYQEQFLEYPRKEQWSDIQEWNADKVVKSESEVVDNYHFSLDTILSELEDVHKGHGKPLRVVKIKRITETEVIKEFRSK